MTTIHDDIVKKRSEQEKARNEIDRLQRLAEEFPGLQKRVGRWDKVAYYTKDVNRRANKFDMRHNCGCCNDSPLEVWPYLETTNGKVYSDPPCFNVGERHWISGDKPFSHWKEDMVKANISETIIDAVQLYFDQCRQDRIDMVVEEAEAEASDE